MSDYMKETERLAQAYADAVLLGDGNDEARAALLAHIQRGAVPEGWQLVPKAPTEEMLLSGMGDDWPEDVYLRDAYELMLSAAPAPDELGDINVADIAQAADATRETAPDQFRDAAEKVAAPAEVPMPDPLERRVSGGGQNERVQMRTLAGLPNMQAGYV